MLGIFLNYHGTILSNLDTLIPGIMIFLIGSEETVRKRIGEPLSLTIRWFGVNDSYDQKRGFESRPETRKSQRKEKQEMESNERISNHLYETNFQVNVRRACKRL